MLTITRWACTTRTGKSESWSWNSFWRLLASLQSRQRPSGLGVIRTDPHRLLEMLDGLRPPVQPFPRNPHAVMRLRIIRLDPQRLRKLFHRLRQPAQPHQGDPEVLVHRGGIRVDP